MKLLIVAAMILATIQAHAETGIASIDDGRPTKYDARNYHGRIATGGMIQLSALTVAHRTLPLGSCIELKNLDRPAPVMVATVDDRGPCGSAYCRKVAPWLLKRIVDLKPRLAALIKCDGLCRISIKPVPCQRK